MKEYAAKAVEHFSQRIAAHGDALEVVDWGSEAGQRLRFDVLYDAGLADAGSVLDVGCGRGDFFPYLKSRNSQAVYTGVDITPGMVGIAAARYPEVRFECRDILTTPFAEQSFDAVVASGIFYLALEDNMAFARRMIAALYSCSARVLAFNMLSALSEERCDNEWYAVPGAILDMCQEFSVHTTLRHDYRRNDFTVYMYRK